MATARGSISCGPPGQATADIILICVDNKAATTRIAELLRDEFPLAR